MKKFIIIGNGGAATYEEIFPLIKNNEIWYGATYFNGGAAYFYGDASVFDPSKISSEKHTYIKDGKLYWRVNGVRWFTNVDHNKRNTPLDLYKTYSEKEYPKFDTYDAINVNKVVEIPTDYNGVMGVPFSFLDKYCPTQFEIVGKLNHNRPQSYDFGKSIVNGKEIYARLLIRKVKDKEKRTMTDFIIIGPVPAMTYKEVYPLLKNKIMNVTERSIHFNQEAEDIKCYWFTTMSRSVDMRRRQLSKTYNSKDYPHYDDYPAIECSNKSNIPIDYYGNIGVPISFFCYYPELPYEIVDGPVRPKLNGKTKFPRLIIRRKQ